MKSRSILIAKYENKFGISSNFSFSILGPKDLPYGLKNLRRIIFKALYHIEAAFMKKPA